MSLAPFGTILCKQGQPTGVVVLGTGVAMLEWIHFQKPVVFLHFTEDIPEKGCHSPPAVPYLCDALPVTCPLFNILSVVSGVLI